MATKKGDPFHDINIEFLKKRVIYDITDPVQVGYAAQGTADTDSAWMVFESTFVANLETERNFAQLAGKENNGFVHSWAAVVEVTEIIINRALVVGNILSVKVDGSGALTETFATDSDTTLAAWAVTLAGQAGVATAVVRDAGGDGTRDGVIVITANVAGTPVVLTELDISGGLQIPGIRFKIIKPNGVAAASKTYGV